jgi:hypothetical protein
MLWKLSPPMPSALVEKPVWFSAVSISSHSRPANFLTVATVWASPAALVAVEGACDASTIIRQP